ncbi:Hypothetical protein, putative [Bodo saltans]|uniref:Transmembrane protein n=1 Tax=Bodo saltans TaxID=75058 RepID=A0A0S4JP60_BODSA|nr:Hypothetical protein, putative [Bodo saltans]|eukprot:CUG92074.1 Hypothetical protein, putative [Bodo saltans]
MKRASFAPELVQDFTDINQVQEEGSESSDDELLDDDSDEFELPDPTTFASVRNAVTTGQFSKYLKDFDTTAAKQAVTFASLPAHVIDEGNRTQLLSQGLEREDEHLQHQNDLDHIDLLRNRRIFEVQRRRVAQINESRRQLRDIQVKSSLTEELLGTYFGFTKKNLDIHLTTRTAEVLQSVGEVRRFERGDYDPNKPDWDTFEQQVELRIMKIRGLKDKIPPGEYVLLVSKWDKLAGQPMQWTHRIKNRSAYAPCPLHSEEKNTTIRSNCEICNGWCGGTLPFTHDGSQRSFETGVNAKVFTFFPSRVTIKPYMALMFELVKLPQKRQGQSKIVGWGVMPCVDSGFSIINGKFRFPILRGEYSTYFSHHETVRKAISDDVENWLGNMYMEIFPHPREHFGRSEFQLHSEFTAHLLNLNDYPSTKDQDGWPVDIKKRGLSFDVANEEELSKGRNADGTDDQGRRKSVGGTVIDDTNYFPYLRPEKVPQLETKVQTWWGIVREAVLDRRRFRKQEQQRVQREAVKKAEEQNQYRFSIHPHGAVLMQSAWSTQVEYCTRAILDEMSLREPKHYKFWLNILVVLLSLMFQCYMRSVFVIIGANSMSVPIDSIDLKVYGLVVNYSYRNTWALQEVLFCLMNLFGNCIAVQSLIWFGMYVRASGGQVPEQLSKFVFALSFSYYLEPWLDLIIDLIADINHGDIMRLGAFFDYHEYGAFYGYLTFAVIFFFFCAIIFVTTFLYTMRLHLNGILQDSYWRILLVDEDNYFVPSDLEVSQREFYHVLYKAERWRGATGKRRKIAVYDLITTDEDHPKYMQKNQYVAIYELNTEDGDEYFALKPMKIFRHFFFTYEGAILECLPDEVPQGVVAAVLRMQSTFLKALTRGGSTLGDPMAMALGAKLKDISLDDTNTLVTVADPASPVAGGRRKSAITFK